VFEVHCVYKLVCIHYCSYMHKITTILQFAKIVIALTLWTLYFYGHPLSRTEATLFSESTKKCMGTSEIEGTEPGNLQRV